MPSNKYVDTRYAARNPAYLRLLEEAERSSKCPFCPPAETILDCFGGWVIVANRFPYEGTAVHLLLIPERHITELGELTIVDIEAVFTLARRAVSGRLIPGGALFLRFGDMRYTGATIHHLHFHLIQPQSDAATGEVTIVRVPVG